MRLSIIIPAYNVEQYLERCVDSCERQDIARTEYEVIIVDDGSKDGTLAVAKRLAEKYDNVAVLTQENGGSSKARNTGLAHAQGDYLWFVDADDYVVENCIGRVLGLCEINDLDICHFSLTTLRSDGSVEPRERYDNAETLLRGRDILLSNSSQVVCSACANFYKRQFFVDYDIRFTEGITQQDVEINGRTFAVAQRCMMVNDEMYMYYYNAESIRRNPNIEKRKKYAGDTVRVAALHRDFYAKHSDTELSQYFMRHTNSRIAGGIYSMVKGGVDKRVLDEFVRVAREKGLYPIKGETLSWKWNLLRPVVNSPAMWWLFKVI